MIRYGLVALQKHQDLIQKLAYEFWQQGNLNALENWLRAEQIILIQLGDSHVTTRKP